MQLKKVIRKNVKEICPFFTFTHVLQTCFVKALTFYVGAYIFGLRIIYVGAFAFELRIFLERRHFAIDADILRRRHFAMDADILPRAPTF